MLTKPVVYSVLISSLFVVSCLTQEPNSDEKSLNLKVSIDAQIYSNGTVLRDDGVLACTKTGPQCDDDCVTLMLCAAGLTDPIATVDCSRSQPDTPYCSNNACSKTPGACTSAAVFKCTSEGLFPDPTNCSRYLSCDESSIGGEGVPFECENGFFYNSQINICQKGRLSSHSKVCNVVDCSDKTNEVVVYRGNPAYYAFCYVDPETSRRETMMFKCDSGDEVYDPKEHECVFRCQKAGHFQDPNNCYYYYVCSASLKAERIKCPPGYYFDGTRCTTDSSKCSPEALEGADMEME